MSVQYDSQGIWSLHIASAYINCLQNTGCWKWVFVILIILVFHLNLNFVVFVILIVSIFQFKLTFVESLMTKYHFLRWTFEFLPNFQCFSKFKDVITLGSKVVALETFTNICAKVLFLCLSFLDWRNMPHFFPRSVQHVHISI